MLATAIVSVRSSSGKLIPSRALLDSESQPNLITEELTQLLRLKREGGRLDLTGISGTNLFSKSSVHFTVISRVNSFQFNAKLWVLSSITNLQAVSVINTAGLYIPNSIKLADTC